MGVKGRETGKRRTFNCKTCEKRFVRLDDNRPENIILVTVRSHRAGNNGYRFHKCPCCKYEYAERT